MKKFKLVAVYGYCELCGRKVKNDILAVTRARAIKWCPDCGLYYTTEMYMPELWEKDKITSVRLALKFEEEAGR